MDAQHGQTYDPQEEPAPRGGWFRLEERPYPERLDKAFRVGPIAHEPTPEPRTNDFPNDRYGRRRLRTIQSQRGSAWAQ